VQNLRGIKAELESVPKTPTKTVLPEEYDASSGHTPHYNQWPHWPLKCR
jgi:hypothetical protein